MATLKNGSSPSKGLNANLVLQTLLEMKTATRKQLAARTGLSQPTVNAIVQELEHNGVVRPGNFAVSAGGRRPKCYILQTEDLRAALVRVLPQGLEHAVLTADGEVIRRNVWPLTPADSILETLQVLLQTLMKQDDDIRVISIGVPGVVGPGGALYAIPEIPCLEGVALGHVLEGQLKIPVHVENDMNLVALGSAASGMGESYSDMVFMHIGKSVGAGIVMGGRIIRGFSSFAGETAYMVKEVGTKRDGETLEHLLKQAEGIPQKAQLIASLVINIICLLNPPVISFSGSLASEEMLRHLRHLCEHYLPLWTLPVFQLMTDERTAYERGLLISVRDVLTEVQLGRARGNTW
ncbi:MAG: ROK family transcriptional regulator [Oscillospiraceae bacterium]|nr:ROK family transcriptional regulator [Oscillospiraceae bacterium]